MELTPDIQVTHTFVNYLNAGFQGQFAQLNVLSQLNFIALNPETVAEARGALDQVSIWLGNLRQNRPLLLARWTYPETQEAQKAVELFDRLQKDLHQLAIEVERTLANQNLGSDKEGLKLLLAALARHAYSRDNYVREFISLGELIARKDIVAEHRRNLQEVEADLASVHALLKEFQQSANSFSTNFLENLISSTLLLPGAFRTHIHDISQLLSRFREPFSYKSAGISPDKAKLWEKFMISPEEAGYWAAQGFAPMEALKWRTLGFDHANASHWKVWGFTPDRAISWFQAGFPVRNALSWYRAGYSTDESLKYISQGYLEPEMLRNKS